MAAGTEGEVVDDAFVAEESLEEFACLCVSKANGAPIIGNSQLLSIAAKGDVVKSPRDLCHSESSFPFCQSRAKTYIRPDGDGVFPAATTYSSSDEKLANQKSRRLGERALISF